MRLDPANEDVVAVDDKVMRGDRCAGVRMRGGVVCALFRGDMFHHDLQFRQFAADRVEDAVDEDGLAVKDVDVGVGDLAVDTKGQANLGHGFQLTAHVAKIGHTRGGVGGCPCGVEFDGCDQADFMSGAQVFDFGLLCQIERHQGLEVRIVGLGGHDAITILGGVFGGDNGRDQVWHDDGTVEVARSLWQDAFEHVSIAQMQVPIVGAFDRECCHSVPQIQR